ncbi:acyclic terpene utilization AtuA family protein [Parvularcula maris]|uniref:DUF1446 domain-containing protein n=1 Tax=Parvularcula maris TaxID=2965077 RepID=A0A9X2L7S3_9PROT|nr:acyclic terpene utilization AtuA family protein [Parvularcula maris]MCQ8184654.1 DUF1446 domain-containing protein [Parvularcula maris]
MKIGGASGYWGDSARSTPQLLGANVDVLVYDYLAEITMSLLARARMKDPEKGGYARDFVTEAMAPHLAQIAEKKVKVLSNAGGVNPKACAEALRQLVKEKGLDLTVAVVEGDDLIGRKEEIAKGGPPEMFSGKAFPHPAAIVSMNAYLGAVPIAKALDAGADIVVTGRCVDSALTLGALMHRFGWPANDYDLLAVGSLVGHLLECGAQATGGNFTDWRDVPDRAHIGYPIAEVSPDGAARITKPDGTGGLVSRETVAEQLLYEIGDPSDYQLPDVRCDFTNVIIAEDGEGGVVVSGAKGRAPSPRLKVSATHLSGWRGGLTPSFYGFEAAEKAEAFANDAVERAQERLEGAGLPPFTEVSTEVLGSGTQFGEGGEADEVVLKLAVRHPDAEGVGALLKEAAGLGLSAPPGLCGFAGTRPKPSPVVELFSFLIPKEDVEPNYDTGDGPIRVPFTAGSDSRAEPVSTEIASPSGDEPMVTVLLIEAAVARSGDKGNDANIGVIARHKDILPYLWAQLTENVVAERFAHVLEGPVERYLMEGSGAINFVLKKSLGGGGIASLRNDPQGKGFSQVMLTIPVRVPERLLAEVLP